MVTYPLTAPTNVGMASISVSRTKAAARPRSPFTFTSKSQSFSGDIWRMSVDMPPMHREDAAQWVAFLMALDGPVGTFVMGDPSVATPMGVATGTPFVNGSGQTGETLKIAGATPSTTGWLKAGDMIQLGSGSSTSMHMVLFDANSDASGVATLSLRPQIRNAPTNLSAVVVSDPKGLWTLEGNVSSWSVDDASFFGLSFTAVEAL